MNQRIDIIFEDENIAVVKKPAGLGAVGDKTGDENLLSILRSHYGTDQLEAVHRLDRPVGGVMVFARSKQAFTALSGQFAARTTIKSYMAVVCGETQEQGELLHYLIKNERLNISKAVSKNTKNSCEARLSYTRLAAVEVGGQTLSLVEVQLFTGRHHQIRIQFQQAGYPLWGDTKYNPGFARNRGFVYLGLWSLKIGFDHPVTGERLLFHVPPHDKEPFILFKV